MRKNLSQIYTEALSVVSPGCLVTKHFSLHPATEALDLVALGKAAVPMALAARQAVRVDRGFVLTKVDYLSFQHSEQLRGQFVLRQGEHPSPGPQAVTATRELASWLSQTRTGRLLVLISGGSSSLLCWPSPPLDLKDLQLVNRSLLQSGLPIEQINILRRHLSEVKGGQLAARAEKFYSSMQQLVLVDICAPQLPAREVEALVGSGPFLSSFSRTEEARRLLSSLSLDQEVRIRAERALHDTPIQSLCQSQVLGDHRLLLQAAQELVGERLLEHREWPHTVTGDVREVAERLASVARQMVSDGRCGILVASGEPTVKMTIDSPGRGGRCQELALRFARSVAGMTGVKFLAGSSDGTDGPTQRAGAVVDGDTWPSLCRLLGEATTEQMLERHDSESLLERVPEALLDTGPTGLNVNDLFLLGVG